MRYYDLIITKPGSTEPFRRWATHPNGQFDANYPLVEFDVTVMPYATPAGASTIVVYGVPLHDLSEAYSWGLHYEGDNDEKLVQGFNLQLKAGMQAGLPLANQKQAGLILSGQVVQSFGNWEGADITLDFVIQPSPYSIENPGNFVLNWRKGMELGDALKNCLEIVYPTMPVTVNMASGYVLNHDYPGKYPTLEALAMWVNQFALAQFGKAVQITIQSGQVLVFDGPSNPTPVQLQSTDFVGQPTWVAPSTVSIKLVMRGDLAVGGLIEMPNRLQTNNTVGFALVDRNSSPSQLKNKMTFTGKFLVTALRHIGNSRSPDGSQWVTIVRAVKLGKQ